MYAKPEKIRGRRLKRQLKAVVSIGLALAAGVFLACQKKPVSEEKVEDARKGASEPQDGGDKSATRDVIIDVTLVDASAPPSADASALAPLPSDAGAKADALAKPVTRDGGKVDKREHRKGMPVPDNLLE